MPQPSNEYGLTKYSGQITQPETQGSSQAMLYATGISEADMNKAQVGIASMWFEGNPCNMHLLDLAREVKKGVVAAGLVGWQFNTIGVSDGISMGTDGMSYSLQSRDIIADSIETLCSAQWHDACIVLPGCDKNMPGAIMALGRLNRPGFMVYGGTIRAGHTSTGEPIDIVSAFTCYGAQLAGKMTDAERREVVRHACPGAGACGGMYTANTMASAIEALGMSLPYSSSIPATDPDKIKECHRAGEVILHCLEKDIKPRDVMTREAFENAMVVVMAVGGSTNAVMHLIAMARSVNVPLTIDDFQAVSDRVPYLADLRPSGKYVQEDLHQVGGTPAVMKLLLENGLLVGDCLTITGKTIAENLKALPGLTAGQDVVRPLSNPIKPTGHIRIMRGNFCPDGAVAKITGKEGLQVHRHRQLLRLRRGHAPRDAAAKDQEGRRRGHPLRRPARRPRHARNALAHRRDHRRRPRQGRRPDHRRPLLRRLGRLHRRPRHPRSPTRRPDRAGEKRRPHHHRRRSQHDQHRPLRRRNSSRAAKRGKPRPTRAPAARSTSTSRT